MAREVVLDVSELEPPEPLVQSLAAIEQLKNGEIQLVINTPAGRQSAQDDSYNRKAAIKHKVAYITTVAAALAAVEGIAAWRRQPADVKSLQAYQRDITE